MDPQLLEALDATEEVQRDGRSAVLRRAVAAYLRDIQRMQIRESYAQAYGAETDVSEELGGWSDEGTWPPE